MELKSVIPYLEAILNAPDDPSGPVDRFLLFFSENRLHDHSDTGAAWQELRRLARELEQFDANASFDDRLAGFFGISRALKLTQRTLKGIKITLSSRTT